MAANVKFAQWSIDSMHSDSHIFTKGTAEDDKR